MSEALISSSAIVFVSHFLRFSLGMPSEIVYVFQLSVVIHW